MYSFLFLDILHSIDRRSADFGKRRKITIRRRGFFYPKLAQVATCIGELRAYTSKSMHLRKSDSVTSELIYL